MRDKYDYLNKLMLTFTYNDPNQYFKMQVINDIKNYLTLLVRNTKNQNIKYYANIELGDDYSNPHLHIQFFYDDYHQIMKIRNKVIEKFGLYSEFCEITLPSSLIAKYDYVIKDYSNSVDDEELLLLDTVKRDYRGNLGKNLRFSSFSKEKYTKATYKKAYSYGILKENVDWLIDSRMINKDVKVINSKVIEVMFLLFLIQLRIKYVRNKFNDSFEIKKQIQYQILFQYWIYGYI
jgi:hypothetical protein